MKNKVPRHQPNRLTRTDAEYRQIRIPATHWQDEFVNERGKLVKRDLQPRFAKIYKIHIKNLRILRRFSCPRRPTVSHLLLLSTLEDSQFPFQISRQNKSRSRAL